LSLEEEVLLQSNVSPSPEEDDDMVNDGAAEVEGGHRGGN
jgi:hypothetical protein